LTRLLRHHSAGREDVAQPITVTLWGKLDSWGTLATRGAAADSVYGHVVEGGVFFFSEDAFEQDLVREIGERRAVFDRSRHWRLSASRSFDLLRCADELRRSLPEKTRHGIKVRVGGF
jgi:hypothetical protein